MPSKLSPVFDRMVQEVADLDVVPDTRLELRVMIIAHRDDRFWVDSCLEMAHTFGVKVYDTRRWWRWRPRRRVYELRTGGTVLDTYRWLVSCRKVADRMPGRQ